MDSFFAPWQRLVGRFLLVIGLGAFLVTGAAAWARPPVAADDSAAETFAITSPAQQSLKPVRPTPSEKAGISLGAVPEVRLKALDTDALLKEDALAERQGRVKGLRYGVGRAVQMSVKDGHWYDLADGARLWVGEIVSPEALGVRLHFKDVRMPAGAVLAVYASPVGDPARGIAKNGFQRFDPERRVEFHDASAAMANRTEFWTGTVLGERARIEYLAPAGAAFSEELPFTVDDLQHLYLDPVDRLAKSLVGAKAPAGACNNDVSCFPEWGVVANAVAGIGDISFGNSIFCTGQLLNSMSMDFTPYWLTANHCLSTSGEAASAEFYWFYQTSSCNGNPPSIQSAARSVGATLVSTNPQSDYTLLMVEGALPDGLTWSGWTSNPVPDGTDAVAIHHPRGDYKRISFGFKDDVAECFDFASFRGRSLVRVSWTDAPTEPGSSGSGIFRADNGQLFGQLLGGPSACGNETFDCYGAFATTYTRVKNNLKGGTDDKSEQNDSCSKARLMRKAGLSASRVIKLTDEDWYKVSVKPGKTVNINLSFANANGDIDLQAFGACNGEVVAASEDTTDGEMVSLTNVGNRPAFVYWRVFLANDTRNTYNMTISFQ
jgi:lysyl endopeptidase